MGNKAITKAMDRRMVWFHVRPGAARYSDKYENVANRHGILTFAAFSSVTLFTNAVKSFSKVDTGPSIMARIW